MAKTQMTGTDALAYCVARVLSGAPTQWGKDQATLANAALCELKEASLVDSPTFADVAGRLGNHSQMRQFLEKHGLLKVSPDALAHAIKGLLAKSAAELLSWVS
jgi:hypothetical protein